MWVKNYEGDASELGLTMSYGYDSPSGEQVVIDLIPNGRNIYINNSNKMMFIQKMADYRLNLEIRRHVEAFRKGMDCVIDLSLL